MLFCPRCSAPQLLLPEHMRIEDPGAAPVATTGTLPPPRVRTADSRQVDWQAALPGAAMVAVAGAVLTMVGLKVNGAALLSVVWLLSAASISLGLYVRRSPRAWMDGRIGLRVGVVTGLLMLAALAVAGAGTGVVLRFGTHGLAQFDEQSVQQTKATQAWWVNWMQAQGQDKDVQAKYVEMLNSPLMTSPEMKAGSELFSLGLEGAIIVLIAAGGGAFAGMLRGRRAARMREN